MTRPPLLTPRLVLRPFRAPKTWPAYAAMNADPKVMEFLGPPETRASSDALAARINAWRVSRLIIYSDIRIRPVPRANSDSD